MSFNASYFYMAAQYYDPVGSVTNTIFPAVSNYADARIIVLTITASLMVLLTLIYCVGYMPRCTRNFDLYTMEYKIEAVDSGSFQPRRKTSKYGGTRK